MRADGGHEDDGVVRVAERSTCSEIVCGGACGRRDAYAVCLYGSEVLVVAEELDARHGWVRASVYYYFVQDVVRAVWFVGVVVLAFFPDELFDEVAVGFVPGLGPHDCCFEAETQRHGDAFAEGALDDLGVEVVVEFCEEAEGAEGEG